MIRVKVFTGEHEYGQAQANRNAENAVNMYLSNTPEAQIYSPIPAISTGMLQNEAGDYWHTCSIAMLMLLPDETDAEGTATDE